MPQSDTVIRDVYDGTEYRKHSAFLSKPENISLLLNTDGVAIFRSSSVSIWPVWVMVNELPRSVMYSVKVQIFTYNTSDSTFATLYSRAAFRGGGGNSLPLRKFRPLLGLHTPTDLSIKATFPN